MAAPSESFDPTIFRHAVSVFAAKRASLAPTAVETLAEEVIRRLAAQGRRVTVDVNPILSPERVAAFCEILVQPHPEAALRFIQDRRDEGISREALYLGYIAAAARKLGEMWEEDRLSFVDVTIGTGHLYALMRALRAEPTSDLTAFDEKRSALFVSVPGEDHGIGITMAADLFRQSGWEIDLQIGTNHDALVAHVERTQPKIIGLSLHTDRQLAALVRLVVALRVVVSRAIIGVAPGTGLDPDHVKGLVDVDLVFTDARSACGELERMVRLRG